MQADVPSHRADVQATKPQAQLAAGQSGTGPLSAPTQHQQAVRAQGVGSNAAMPAGSTPLQGRNLFLGLASAVPKPLDMRAQPCDCLPCIFRQNTDKRQAVCTVLLCRKRSHCTQMPHSRLAPYQWALGDAWADLEGVLVKPSGEFSTKLTVQQPRDSTNRCPCNMTA